MSLMDQYRNVFELANQVGIRDPDVKEQGGKLQIRGFTKYQLDANRLWDAIKTHPNWENEVEVDLRPDDTELQGIHTVVSGDSLSKLAKDYLGNASRYMEIFNINTDQLSDPSLIKIGQQLKIPNA